MVTSNLAGMKLAPAWTAIMRDSLRAIAGMMLMPGAPPSGAVADVRSAGQADGGCCWSVLTQEPVLEPIEEGNDLRSGHLPNFKAMAADGIAIDAAVQAHFGPAIR